VMLSKPTWLLGKMDEACCDDAAAAAIVNVRGGASDR
jgi:hypothetical protein